MFNICNSRLNKPQKAHHHQIGKDPEAKATSLWSGLQSAANHAHSLVLFCQNKIQFVADEFEPKLPLGRKL